MTNVKEKECQRFVITGPESFFSVLCRCYCDHAILQGDVICDYYGRVIPQCEGEKMMDKLDEGMGYLFFFKGMGGVKLCIDAQTFPCECHPQKDTFGKRMNHSGKNFNVRPVHFKLKFPDGPRDTILFLATRDIKCNEELLWDYG